MKETSLLGFNLEGRVLCQFVLLLEIAIHFEGTCIIILSYITDSTDEPGGQCSQF